jgi:GTP-binding protein
MRNQAGAVEFVGSYPAELPELGLPEIAFAGRSNVGKSSALNKLLNRRTARTSGRPGRTQTINLFKVGEACVFADLPGYGYAKVPVEIRDGWKGMIDGYLETREMLRLVVVLVDVRREPQDMDAGLIEALADLELPTLLIATKVDKLTRNQRIVALRTLLEGFDLPEDAVVPFSSVTGEGVDEVWARIEAVCA